MPDPACGWGEHSEGAAGVSYGPLAFRVIFGAALILGVSHLGVNLPARSITSEAASAGRRIHLSGGQPLTVSTPDGQPREIKSVLNIPSPMRYGQFAWDDEGVPAGELWVRVDLEGQTLSVFRAGHEVGTAVILYGADDKPTPTGAFPVLEKREHHRSSLYDAPMPYTLRLTNDGVAIHGSDVRWGAATHGCIGVPTAFASRLFRHVQKGDKVFVLATGRDTTKV